MNLEKAGVAPASAIAGEDAEETALLLQSLDDAAAYLTAFKWCHGINESFFGFGVGGVVAVFLFNINSDPDKDAWLWVVSGDLPSCYLVTDCAKNPVQALRVYCELMEDWVRAVQLKQSVSDVFPVDVTPTKDNAEALARRVEFLRDEIIPAFSHLERHR